MSTPQPHLASFTANHPAVSFAKAVREAAGKDIAYVTIQHGPNNWGLAEVYEGEDGYRLARAPKWSTEAEAQHACDVINTALGNTPERVRQLHAASIRADMKKQAVPT